MRGVPPISGGTTLNRTYEVLKVSLMVMMDENGLTLNRTYEVLKAFAKLVIICTTYALNRTYEVLKDVAAWASDAFGKDSESHL